MTNLELEREDLVTRLQNPNIQAIPVAVAKLEKKIAELDKKIANSKSTSRSVNAPFRKTGASKKAKARAEQEANKSTSKTVNAPFKKIGASKKAKAAAEKKNTATKSKTSTAKKASGTTAPKKATASKPPKPSGTVTNKGQDVKLIEQVYALNGKQITKADGNRLVRAFNRAITARTVNRNMATASLFEKIHNYFFKLVRNAGEKERTDTIQFSAETSNEIAEVLANNVVMDSVAVLQSYVNMQGKQPSMKSVDNWLKRANKVATNDKYAGQVKIAKNVVAAYKQGKTTDVVITKSQLNGLAGVGIACNDPSEAGRTLANHRYNPQVRAKKDRDRVNRTLDEIYYPEKYAKKRGGKKKSKGVSGLGCGCEHRAVNSTNLDDLDYNAIIIPEEWKAIMGEPPRNVAIMLAAREGQGKTTLALKFSNDFIKNDNGKVLYVSSEQFGSPIFKKQIDRLKAVHKDLVLIDRITDENKNIIEQFTDTQGNVYNTSDFSLIIIDSLNDSELTDKDIKRFRKEYPDIAFMSIVRLNQDKTYRGVGALGVAYDSDVVIEFKDTGIAYNRYKNRCGEKGEMNVFDYVEQS